MDRPDAGSGLADGIARALRAGGIVVVLALTATMLRVEWRSPLRSLPRAHYVVGVASMVLFAFVARDPFLLLVHAALTDHTALLPGATSFK